MKRWLTWVVAPLALGVLGYLALRAPEIRLFGWAHAVGIPIAWIRSIAAPVRPYVPAVVVGSLPDACWAFAFGAALALVWKRPSAWMWLGAGVTAAIELLQGAHAIEGVFDPVDLCAMIAAYFVAWRACCDSVVTAQRALPGAGDPSIVG
jgi:hypothetical protein